MYQCPSCGGELKFDIVSQQLKCTFCQQLAEPSSFQEVSGAEENDTFQVTEFVCPQCGAAIISEDNTAAAFCSFCGASTVLESRVSNQKRPHKILPFQKTKQDCVRIYRSLMRRAFFVPSALKSDECIESFRGIYMPYWVYDITYDGDFHMDGTHRHQHGDYLETDHYDLTGTISAEYNGISHDASKDFADDISESIAPYNVQKATDFNASYLSGFYADIADTNSNHYTKAIFHLTDQLVEQEILNCHHFSAYHPTVKVDSFPLSMGEPNYALFPVWFMSYRYCMSPRLGERIGYVTINGQTGRAAADLPIDTLKYAIGALILAIPLFLVINPVLFMSAPKTLGLAAVFALITMLIARKEHKQLESQTMEKKDEKEPKRDSALSIAVTMQIVLLVFVILLSYCPQLIPFAFVAALICYFVKNKAALAKLLHKKGEWLCLCAALVSVLVLIAQPVSDYYYYGGTILCAVTVFVAFSEIIANYNLLTTRPLPQFQRKGGDDRVEK